MVATADLWVYNAEHFCVSFSNQVASTFHLGGGKIKKKFFGPNYCECHGDATNNFQNWGHET